MAGPFGLFALLSAGSRAVDTGVVPTWDRDQALIEARAVGLPGGHATLSDVDRRRLQLLAFAGVALGGIALAATLRPAAAPLVPVDLLRPALAVLGLAVVLYVGDRERRLRRLTRWLVDERASSSARMMRLDEIHGLLDVAKAVNAEGPLDATFATIVRVASGVLGARATAIELLNGDVVEVAALAGPGPEVGSTFPLAGDPAERVAMTWEASVSPTDDGRARALRVPVRHVTELLAVLVVEVEGERLFSDYDVRTAEVFAEQAACAIAASRRVDDVRRDRDEREARDEARAGRGERAVEVLRDPVSSMVAATKMLQQRKGLDNGSLELTRIIERQAERIRMMVEQLIADRE